ncbi:hypothetical protein PF005_g24582 [Phytophthora fragariae]|uniref:Uncharacterized protein n=1 Tax=Phytophthora fragariae TaxID=53985 RepID=A0A6A3WU53_9STRA|nr:hypothetical protein PF003_g16792 [Phytophthora fragariae]KAE8924919.1 hypothetical protein PF009_g24859 [Phytophthora fragariae]KAE8972090.1 hypothetical protein PF011_g25775 [Phytophthora fragariae]KAE9076576.1 hypothetical protein PF007_g24578 [Phytophthora fragariae]KAE9077852.1 hypothetical protein PF010_g23350 [Phytophthora fragariae]
MRCGTHLEASWAAAAAVPWSQFICALCAFGSADSSAVAYSLYVGPIMVEFDRGDPLAMSRHVDLFIHRQGASTRVNTRNCGD